MNKKIITVVAIILIATATAIINAAENDYRTYVYAYSSVKNIEGDGNNATISFRVAYIPMNPGVTYNLVNIPIEDVKIDLSKPNNVNNQLAQAVKVKGEQLGFNVTKVYLPAYEQKVP